jgi:threonine/homoserine/homoserine lactone efflux protein
MLGYMTTILPLAYLGAATLDRWPAASALLKIAAASWVLYLALRLWRAPSKARALCKSRRAGFM